MELKDYSKFCNIKLEDTGVFNYKGGQSSVYNRLINNNITTLKELFEADDLKKIQYGTDKLGQNYFIHSEIEGIIKVLRFKYLDEKSDELVDLLDYKPINTLNIDLNKVDYGYPGYVFNDVIRFNSKTGAIYEFYKILKQCGFDQFCTKAILDLIYMRNIDIKDKNSSLYLAKIDDINLAQLLSQIKLDEIKKMFSKIPNEYFVFINILNILLEHYKKYNIKTNKKIS